MFSLLVLAGTLNSAFAQESTVTVVEKKPVTLIGQGFDEDNDVLTFQWEQVSGEPVTLSATDEPEPTFMAPSVENGKTKELVFKLTVSDPFGAEDTSSVKILVKPVNSAPFVYAGMDKVILPTISAMTLFPTVYDEDHDVIYYHWKQIGGQSIDLILSSQKHLTITPSEIDFSNPEPLTFEITVSDGYGGISSDTVNIFPVLFEDQRNPLLYIDAGPIQEVGEGTTVTLHGSGQSVFGTEVSFRWSQNVGEPVVLSNPVAAEPTFVAPKLYNDRPMLLSFTLSGYAPISGYASDLALVKVVPVHLPPIADAGDDQEVFRNTKVRLDGSAKDPDGDPVKLEWKQLSGTPVSLDTSLYQVSFTAPNVNFGETETLTFQLTATDSDGLSDTDDVKITVSAMNRQPFVSAGQDRTVSENTKVTLRGTGHDADNDPITFSWSQVSGSALKTTKISDSEISFTTPNLLPGQKKIFVFGLKGTDPYGLYDSDSVSITVIPENAPPTANAGPDQRVLENSKTTLTCQGTDPENNMLSFSWRQIGGLPKVILGFSTTGTTTFTAPPVIQNTNLTFECRVSDGQTFATDSVNVLVRNLLNMPIVADAGPDRIVNEKITITLDGTQSNDPENQEIFFSWKQKSGDKVNLLGATSTSPSFTTPSVQNNEIKVLEFELRVYDNNGRESFDTVQITVDPINAEPSASASARQD